MHDPKVQAALAAAPDLTGEVEVLRKNIAARTNEKSALIGMGSGWIAKTMDNVRETVSRITGAPGSAVSTVLLEIRKPLNALLTMFTGDVFVYLNSRGNAQHPGAVSYTHLLGMTAWVMLPVPALPPPPPVNSVKD